MPGHDIIVIGASAGGVEALSQLVQSLPADLSAAVFVVLHISPYSVSVMPQILTRAGTLPAKHAQHGEPIRPGQIYVAPPDHHLLVRRGQVHVARGPRENGHRPAVDPLFRTAAYYYGQRVTGVVLSGALDDGTAGLQAIKQRGGVAVVQDPEEAFHPGMPTNAIENVAIDHILPLSQISTVLVDLAHQEVGEVEEVEDTMPEAMEIEAAMAELEPAALHRAKRPGTPSGFSCPECHGVLFELTDSELLRFRCRVGHAFSADSLLAEQSEALEAALWTALRALEESAALARRIAARSRERDRFLSAQRFDEQALEAEHSAAVIRRTLLKGEGAAPDGLDAGESSVGVANGKPTPGEQNAAGPDIEGESGLNVAGARIGAI